MLRKRLENQKRLAKNQGVQLGDRLLDPEIVDPPSRLEVRGQPARLLAPARPSLRRQFRISKFWENDRIGSAVGLFPRLLCLDSPIELPQAIFKQSHFRAKLCSERRSDFFAQRP